jgi:hypothetical protein
MSIIDECVRPFCLQDDGLFKGSPPLNRDFATRLSICGGFGSR